MKRNLTVLQAVAVSIMLLPLTIVPAAGGKASYSCAVSVQYVGSPVTSFAVRTTVSATGRQLPLFETDFLQSFKNGLLYDSSREDFTVPHKSTTATVTVMVLAYGSGVYTFGSTVGVVRGSGSFVRLAECSMTAAL